MPGNMIGIILSLGNTPIKTLMPITFVYLVPLIGNLPIPCLWDAYNYLQCTRFCNLFVPFKKFLQMDSCVRDRNPTKRFDFFMALLEYGSALKLGLLKAIAGKI